MPCHATPRHAVIHAVTLSPSLRMIWGSGSQEGDVRHGREKEKSSERASERIEPFSENLGKKIK